MLFRSAIGTLAIYGLDADTGDSLTLTVAFSAGDSTGYASDPFSLSGGGIATATAPSVAQVLISGSAATPGVAVYRIELDDGRVSTPVEATMTITVVETINSEPQLYALAGLTADGDDWVATLNQGEALSNIGFFGYDPDIGDGLILTIAFDAGASKRAEERRGGKECRCGWSPCP